MRPDGQRPSHSTSAQSSVTTGCNPDAINARADVILMIGFSVDLVPDCVTVCHWIFLRQGSNLYDGTSISKQTKNTSDVSGLCARTRSRGTIPGRRPDPFLKTADKRNSRHSAGLFRSRELKFLNSMSNAALFSPYSAIFRFNAAVCSFSFSISSRVWTCFLASLICCFSRIRA